MLHKKICVVCGGNFYSQRKNAVTCSEVCRRKRQTIVNQEKRETKEAECNSIKIYQSRIDKINEMARSQGLSYGKYKALEYMKANNI